MLKTKMCKATFNKAQHWGGGVRKLTFTPAYNFSSGVTFLIVFYYSVHSELWRENT